MPFYGDLLGSSIIIIFGWFEVVRFYPDINMTYDAVGMARNPDILVVHYVTLGQFFKFVPPIFRPFAHFPRFMLVPSEFKSLFDLIKTLTTRLLIFLS